MVWEHGVFLRNGRSTNCKILISFLFPIRSWNWQTSFRKALENTLKNHNSRQVPKKQFSINCTGEKWAHRTLQFTKALKSRIDNEFSLMAYIEKVASLCDMVEDPIEILFNNQRVQVPPVAYFGLPSRFAGPVMPRYAAELKLDYFHEFWETKSLLRTALAKKLFTPGAEWDGGVATQNIAADKKSIVWTLSIKSLVASFSSSWPIKRIISCVGLLTIGNDVRPYRMVFIEECGELSIELLTHTPAPKVSDEDFKNMRKANIKALGKMQLKENGFDESWNSKKIIKFMQEKFAPGSVHYFSEMATGQGYLLFGDF